MARACAVRQGDRHGGARPDPAAADPAAEAGRQNGPSRRPRGGAAAPARAKGCGGRDHRDRHPSGALLRARRDGFPGVPGLLRGPRSPRAAIEREWRTPRKTPAGNAAAADGAGCFARCLRSAPAQRLGRSPRASRPRPRARFRRRRRRCRSSGSAAGSRSTSATIASPATRAPR